MLVAKRGSSSNKTPRSAKSYARPRPDSIKKNGDNIIFKPGTSTSRNINIGEERKVKEMKSFISSKKPTPETTPSPSMDLKASKIDDDVAAKKMIQFLYKRSLRTQAGPLNWTQELAGITDSKFLAILEELKSEMEHFENKMDPLIQQLIDGNWMTRSPQVVKKMESFIHEFLIIRESFVGTVVHSLIKNFVTPESSSQPDQISESELKIFAIAHRNLKKIASSFQTSKDIIVKQLDHFYPYIFKSAHLHFCFVKNALQTIKYIPDCKFKVLHLIISRLCRIDVFLPAKDVEEYSEMLNLNLSSNVKVKGEDGDVCIQAMECDWGNNGQVYTPNPLIENLDLSLRLLFKYLDEQINHFNELKLREEGDGELNEGEAQSTAFLDGLITIFEKEVLPTFGLHHVQFLFFYFLNSSSKHPQRFLKALWTIASNPNSSQCIRVQASSYISGILSKAQYVPISLVKKWLYTLAKYACKYNSKHSDKYHWSNVNIFVHGPYYALCQAIFYVYTFRNKEISENWQSASVLTKELELGTLITSNLNPLRACVSSITNEFIKVAHIHQVSYCNTIKDRNEKATIPTITKNEMNESETQSILLANSLESFFPFDSYLLPRTRNWIDPLYRTYEPYLPETKIELKEEEFMDEDSIEMDLCVERKPKKKKSKSKIKAEEIEESFENFID